MSRPQQYPDSSEPPWSLSLILSPPNSSWFLVNLRPLLQGGVRLGSHSFYYPVLQKQFLLSLISQEGKEENSIYYIQSPEQVSVRAELISRALIIGYDGRQVVGRNGSKRQEVNNKGCPHPLSLHTPPEAILWVFVNTDLKRDTLAMAWGWSFTIRFNADIPQCSLNTTQADNENK